MPNFDRMEYAALYIYTATPDFQAPIMISNPENNALPLPSPEVPHADNLPMRHTEIPVMVCTPQFVVYTW